MAAGSQWDARGAAAAFIQRLVMFVAGLGLLGHEAVVRTQEPRWPLLVIYAGMMGLPLALKADDLLPPSRERDQE